jgi:uncharacterized protein YehS (DUF1456 family)
VRDLLAKPRPNRLAREITWLHNLMVERGSLDFARAAAGDFLSAAQRSFEQAYRDCPENEHKVFLRGLTQYVVDRDR